MDNYKTEAENFYKSKEAFLYARRVQRSQYDLQNGRANSGSIKHALDNLKKMPKARREKFSRAGVTYESLLDRANKLYQSHTALGKKYETARQERKEAIDDLAQKWQENIEQHLESGTIDYEIDAPALLSFYEKAKQLGDKNLVQRIDNTLSGLRSFKEYVLENKPAEYLNSQEWTPEAKNAAKRILDRYQINYKQAREPGLLQRVANYALRTAAAIALTAAISCGKADAPKPAEQPKAPISVNQPVQKPEEKPDEQPFIGPKQEETYQPTLAKGLEIITRKLHPEEPKQENKIETKVAAPQKQEEKKDEPAKLAPINTQADSGTQVKGILKGDSYFDGETSRYSGTGKAILDFGKTGIDIYGSIFNQTQEFDDTAVDGNGSRLWLGAHAYLPLSDKTSAFLEAAGGIERRGFTINPENGNDFDFGNESPFANLKLGLTNGQFDDDDFGIGDKTNKALFQITKHWGDATGDVDGEYDALRAQLKARLMLNDDWSLEAGASYFKEELGDFLSQKNLSAELGARWHLGKDEQQAYIEALLLYRDLHGEIFNRESNDTQAGFKLGAGYRLLDTGNFAVDFGINAGALRSREDDETEWFIAPSVTLYLGGKRKK